MNPLRVRGCGYGRFAEFDVEIPQGCVALVGPNGSGKSRLLSAIELALFADGSKDLAPWVAPWADRLELELTFDHAGETYRVRRGYKATGRGSATLDLEKHILHPESVGAGEDGCWLPMTRETAAQTQAAIVDLLGLSRTTFNASSFLGQGNAAAFPDATATERKQLLGEILDPRGMWPRLAELAHADVRVVQDGLVADTLRIEALAETVAQAAGLPVDLGVAKEEHALTATNVADAEGVLERALAAETENAGAAERVKAAAAAVNAARALVDRHQAEAQHATAEAAKIPVARERLHVLELLAARVPDLEKGVAGKRADEAQLADAKLTQERAASEVAQTARRVDEIRRGQDSTVARRGQLSARLDHLLQPSEDAKRCYACMQILGAQDAETSIATLRREVDELDAKAKQDSEALAAAVVEHAAATETHRQIQGRLPEVRPADEALLVEARAAAERAATGRALIAGYEETAGKLVGIHETLRAAAADLDAKEQELATVSGGVKGTIALAADVSLARQVVAIRRGELEQVAATIVRLDERIAAAAEARKQLVETRARTEQAQTRLDILKLAERAYGRDGIPVLLVESVIPQIEAEANRILEQMPTSDGVVFTVELRTQKALKSDSSAVRETLDILVSDPDGERSYETYSGGERARLNIALRIALARLLAHRRGAESRLLAIDELEYLDAQGQESLVDVIQGVAADFDRVIVVSHSPNVRDAFDATIEIEKRDGVSAIVGAREPAEVGA